MKVAFRTDASLQIGSGHVMRCLTLADALRAQGADCHFICREHPGHLLETICQRGYKVSRLAAVVPHAQESTKTVKTSIPDKRQELTHEIWLGSTWQIDAQQSITSLDGLRLDWLIVDHYALDCRWETALAPHYQKLLVIDDLADRVHRCNLLLNQNLGSQPHGYTALVPAHCQLLIGSQFSLLRPEFAALRSYSLQRRHTRPAFRHLLVTMGGIDQPNATGQVLLALKTCALPRECRITVVMGLTAPWLETVRELAAQMPWPTEVVVNVNDMARRMADSDLAIGAAGGTSWERCCLGLPTLMVVLAENQRAGARALEAAGAALLIGAASDVSKKLHQAVQEVIEPDVLGCMSFAASAVTRGQGVEKVLSAMEICNA